MLGAKRKGKGQLIVGLLVKAACGNSNSNITITKLVSKHCNSDKSLHRLRQLHAHAAVSGILSPPPHADLFLAAFLATAAAAASPPPLRYALSLFRLIQNPSTFCFNHAIRAHTLLSSPLSALRFFRRMRRALSLSPDFHTFPFALAACAQLGPPHGLSAARAIHSQALRLGFGADSFLLNSLIRVYSVSRCLSDAGRVFGETQAHRDVVSYNTLMDGLVKAGEVSRARELFDEMPRRDSVSWGTMVAGYARSGSCDEAIRLFFEMVESGVGADNTAVVSALSACAQLGDLERGRSVHHYILENRIGLDSFLTTGLVDLYAKCGCIEFAKEMFDSSSDKSINLCTWNAMIVGFAMHGLGELSLSYFRRMIDGGFVKPDGITFLGVLVGCSHGGLVDEARTLFAQMESVYGVPRELKHYGCMADILGRAGLIGEATEMIGAMPMQGDVFVWGGLLAGCRLHGDVVAAEKAAERVMEVKPDDGGVYSVMAGVYAQAEQWEAVVRVRRRTEKAAIKKSAGVSLVRLGGVTHEFVASDGSHPQSHDIYSVLNAMDKHQLEPF